MFKAFFHLFFGSLAGKFAGVLREILLAGLFGTSGMVAALRTAQSATLVPVNFFTADALSAGFLPLYARYRDFDVQRAGALFWWTAGLLLAASVLIVAILLVGAPYWIGVLVPGFGLSERALTVEFVQIMALGVPFYIAGGLFSYLEMGNGVYVLASARATLQSAGMIAGTVAAFLLHEPSLLAWGFTLSYVAYSAWGFSRILGRGWVPFSPRLRAGELAEVAREFWSVVRPLVFVPVLLQGNVVIERAVASLLGVRASAALDYAKFISDTGVLLFAVPLGLAGLSAISKMTAARAQATLNELMPPLLITTVPVSMVLAVNSHWVIMLIYERGHFDAASTHLTQLVLLGYAGGFWAQVVSYVLIKALSARLRNRDVCRFMAAALIANATVNFAFYRVLGPLVLGLGGCAYGLVLLFFSARASGVGRVVFGRFAWLAVGGAVYTLCSLALDRPGWPGLAVAAVWSAVFWAGFVASVPLLRSDVQWVIAKWRATA